MWWNEADLASLYRDLAGLWEQLADARDLLTRENLIVAIGLLEVKISNARDASGYAGRSHIIAF
jgi:hypothetical protein